MTILASSSHSAILRLERRLVFFLRFKGGAVRMRLRAILRRADRVSGGGIFADLASIFPEVDVEHPMQAIFQCLSESGRYEPAPRPKEVEN
jgi:hypothetical protein